jgi:hypothetical protein
MTRQSVSSGTVWESMAGYCRAVRVGDDRILRFGHHRYRPRWAGGWRRPGGADALRPRQDRAGDHSNWAGGWKMSCARASTSATLRNWEAVARVHGERFGHIRPVNTLVEAHWLVGPQYLVEIEAEAIVGSAA